MPAKKPVKSKAASVALDRIVAFGSEPAGPAVIYEHDPATDAIPQVTLIGGDTGVSVQVYLRGGGPPMEARCDAGQTEVLPVTGLTMAAIDHAEAASPPNF